MSEQQLTYGPVCSRCGTLNEGVLRRDVNAKCRECGAPLVEFFTIPVWAWVALVIVVGGGAASVVWFLRG